MLCVAEFLPQKLQAPESVQGVGGEGDVKDVADEPKEVLHLRRGREWRDVADFDCEHHR